MNTNRVRVQSERADAADNQQATTDNRRLIASLAAFLALAPAYAQTPHDPRPDEFVQGCLGVEIAVRNLRKEETPKEIILKPVVIDKTNYQPYEVPIEQRQCPKLSETATK